MHIVVRGGFKAWNTLMDQLQAELESDTPPATQGWKGKAVQRGIELEDIALRQAALDRSWDLIQPPCVVHPKISYIAASSDALVVQDFEPIANVECKNPSNEHRHTIVRMNATVPAEHHVQICCQLAVHDLPLSYFVSYFPEAPDHWSRLCILEFERDHALESEMLEKADKFMAIFLRGDRAQPRQVSKASGFPDLTF